MNGVYCPQDRHFFGGDFFHVVFHIRENWLEIDKILIARIISNHKEGHVKTVILNHLSTRGGKFLRVAKN